MRKYTFILLCFLYFSVSVKGQAVKVERCDFMTDSLFSKKQFHILKNIHGVTLIPYNKTNSDNLAEKYYINISNVINDTVQIISELLKLEGDERLLCIPITCNSDISSTFFTQKVELSVQVYALYLIWGFYFDYRTTAAWPVLTKHGRNATIKGDIIRDAFKSYQIWFRSNMHKLNQKKPLDYSDVTWLF